MSQKASRYILITGAEGLIGSEISREFLKKDYFVYGVDFKKNKSSPKNVNYKFIKCDLAKPAEVQKLIQSVSDLHVLVNCVADTSLTFKEFSKVTLKDWQKGIAVNLTSFFLLSQGFSDTLSKNKGSIINVASTRHLMSEPNTVIYSASKGGVVSLTHSLAVTLSGKVRVNSVSPGWIASPTDKLSKKDHEQHPVHRVGQPSDISQICLFLAGGSAAFITGQDFIVDGGMTRKMIYD